MVNRYNRRIYWVKYRANVTIVGPTRVAIGLYFIQTIFVYRTF